MDWLSSGNMSFDLIVWCLYFGIIIAGLLSVYHKKYLGAFVRALIENEAYSPDRAMTLEELGLEKKLFLKSAIKHDEFKALVYFRDDEVNIVGDTAVPVYHKKIDFTNERFYIPYELRIRAGMRYEKHGNHIVLAVISAVFFLAIAILLTSFYDEIREFINGILNLSD